MKNIIKKLTLMTIMTLYVNDVKCIIFLLLNNLSSIPKKIINAPYKESFRNAALCLYNELKAPLGDLKEDLSEEFRIAVEISHEFIVDVKNTIKKPPVIIALYIPTMYFALGYISYVKNKN